MKKTLLLIAVMASMLLVVPRKTSAHTGTMDLAELDVQGISITYNGDVMHVVGANNLMVTIYNLAGVAVKSFRVEGPDKRFNLSLTDGIYIVKVGSTFTRKIVVRR